MNRRSSSLARWIVGASSAALLIPAVVAAAPAAQAATSAQTGSAGWKHHAEASFDAAVLRPLGMIALVVGGAFVVPIALVTWPTGTSTIETAVERFVTTPAQDLFERPLGEF